jgi:hypothetical protein
LGEFSTIGRISLGSFLTIGVVPTPNFLSYFCPRNMLRIDLDKNLVGIHFGRLVRKLIWSPCSGSHPVKNPRWGRSGLAEMERPKIGLILSEIGFRS